MPHFRTMAGRSLHPQTGAAASVRAGRGECAARSCSCVTRASSEPSAWGERHRHLHGRRRRVLAGKYTLLNQDSLDDLIPHTAGDGFSIVIGSVFSSGILATGATPGAYYDNSPATPEIAVRVDSLETAANRHGVSLAALAFYFALAHPAVSSVLVGMG